MTDQWPVIAGIGAGIAAAAAVGQMIVAAIALGAQDASDREVDRMNGEIESIKSKLESMQRQLAAHGFRDDKSAPDTIPIRANIRDRATSVSALAQMEAAMEVRLNREFGIKPISRPSVSNPRKSAMTMFFEDLGRDYVPFNQRSGR